MVSIALRRNSSCPVASVKVSVSKIRSPGCMPYSPTQMSWITCATASLRAAVLAMPSASIVSATHAAPWRTACGTTASIRSRPFSMLIELISARPG